MEKLSHQSWSPYSLRIILRTRIFMITSVEPFEFEIEILFKYCVKSGLRNWWGYFLMLQLGVNLFQCDLLQSYDLNTIRDCIDQSLVFIFGYKLVLKWFRLADQFRYCFGLNRGKLLDSSRLQNLSLIGSTVQHDLLDAIFIVCTIDLPFPYKLTASEASIKIKNISSSQHTFFYSARIIHNSLN